MIKAEVVFDGDSTFINGFRIQADAVVDGNPSLGYEPKLFFRVARSNIDSISACERIFKTQIEAVVFCMEQK